LKARDWSWLQAAELGSNSNYAYYACAGNSLAPEFFSNPDTSGSQATIEFAMKYS